MIFRNYIKRGLVFIGIYIFLNSLAFSSNYGEDLKGDCIATLPDQSRSSLEGIKQELSEIEEEDTTTPTKTKSK